MKKIGVTIASFLAVTVLASGTAIHFAKNQVVADAAPISVAEHTQNGLVAPQTYEEYLALNSPSCIAVCENYTAIADGNLIYVFDRAYGEYKTYEHGDGRTQDQVKTMQFHDGNTLYFADNSTGDNFYKLNATTMEPALEIEDIACGTFLIVDENLYFTNASGALYATTLQDAENDGAKTSLLWDDVSALAYYNSELYFVRSDSYLHKINPRNVETPDPNKTWFATLSQVSSLSIC